MKFYIDLGISFYEYSVSLVVIVNRQEIYRKKQTKIIISACNGLMVPRSLKRKKNTAGKIATKIQSLFLIRLITRFSFRMFQFQSSNSKSDEFIFI